MEPTVMLLPPGAISGKDRAALRRAGVVVVEIEDPHTVRFMRAGYELSHSKLLNCAGEAIGRSEVATKAFGEAIAHLLRTRPTPPNPEEGET